MCTLGPACSGACCACYDEEDAAGAFAFVPWPLPARAGLKGTCSCCSSAWDAACFAVDIVAGSRPAAAVKLSGVVSTVACWLRMWRGFYCTKYS